MSTGYPISTFKIPDTAISDLLFSTGCESVTDAISALHSKLAELECKVSNKLEAHRDDIDASFVAGFTSDALNLIIDQYDPKYGENDLPVWNKATLEHYEHTFESEPDFAYFVTISARPNFIVHDGRRIAIEPNLSIPKVSGCNYSPRGFSYSRRKVGSRMVMDITLDDDILDNVVDVHIFILIAALESGKGQVANYD